MSVFNIQMIFLGNFADMDTNETNGVTENAGAILGNYDQPTIVDVAADDVNGDFFIDDDESGGPDEFLTYDAGSGPTSQLLDSTQTYFAELLLEDGSIHRATVTVIQLQNGDVFATDIGNGGSLDNLNFRSIELTGIAQDDAAGFTATSSVDNSSVVCFTPGTMIETSHGATPVEMLKLGDLVRTHDHGFQPVRWIGCRTLRSAELVENAHLRPVVIRNGALGNNRRMLVSPQHGFLVGETFVRAKHLAQYWGGKVAHVDRKSQSVTYIHFLCDRHEVVFADGVATESLYPGPFAFEAMTSGAIAELTGLFPELVRGRKSRDDIEAAFGTPARHYATGAEIRKSIRKKYDIDGFVPVKTRSPAESVPKANCAHAVPALSS